MNNKADTLEGWYWNYVFSGIMRQIQDQKVGGSFKFQAIKLICYYSFGSSVDVLSQIEIDFNKTKFADYTIRATSYLSVVELSNYLPNTKNPYENPAIMTRLYPDLPTNDYLCFYPMNKLRNGNDNWQMLSNASRKSTMKDHSIIGRKYAGKVKQIILGSIGLDDYEWGVALFSDDPLNLKKLIYEMRFDEVSARFGEFGSFYIEKKLTSKELTFFYNFNLSNVKI